MKNLLTVFTGGSPTLEAAPAQTLDQLWAEAERLGRIEVDRPVFSDDYRVSIRFQRRSGTTIYAKAQDRSVHFAMAAAINEARELGAGVDQ